ncbi:MAG: thioredoxin family protein [Actinobacteria bacterium]|nr:thioredoxin family protein [Actinomycetota bacterium]
MTRRVILVREWDEQHSGSGCCGRLGGERTELGEAATYHHTRCDMEAMGAVYRALRSEFDRAELDVQVVDPRNSLWLVPTIWRDARRRGMTVGEAVTQVRRGVSALAIVIDGRVVFAGGVPEPGEVVEAVRTEPSAA